MAEGKKKVILVTGKNSCWYEQAIFIINEGSRLPMDMVKEAEGIIQRYIANGGGKTESIYDKYRKNSKTVSYQKKNDKKKKQNSSAHLFINFAIIMSMVLVCVLMYMVFKL